MTTHNLYIDGTLSVAFIAQLKDFWGCAWPLPGVPPGVFCVPACLYRTVKLKSHIMNYFESCF